MTLLANPRQHIDHFLFAKAAQISKLRQEIEILRHVIAAGHIAHDQRRDPGDKDPFQTLAPRRRFDHLEDGLEKAFAHHHLFVAVTAGMEIAHQHFVGKVIIFVDQEIELVGGLAHRGQQRSKGQKRILWVNGDGAQQKFFIVGHKAIDLAVDMVMDILLHRFGAETGHNHRKVPGHDKIAVV